MLPSPKPWKLVEHYGAILPESTIRRVTELHAQEIYATIAIDEAWPRETGCETVAVEMDVRSCHRYLSRRKDQLDYTGALANNLPIGSGKIESAHRHIVQKRPKLTGSWWCAANAEHMLALRLNRANGQWGNYWNQARNAA